MQISQSHPQLFEGPSQFASHLGRCELQDERTKNDMYTATRLKQGKTWVQGQRLKVGLLLHFQSQ